MRCGLVAGRAVSLFQLARFLRHAEMLSTAQFALAFANIAACQLCGPTWVVATCPCSLDGCTRGCRGLPCCSQSRVLGIAKLS